MKMDNFFNIDDEKPSILTLRASVEAYSARIQKEWADARMELSGVIELPYSRPTLSPNLEKTGEDCFTCSSSEPKMAEWKPSETNEVFGGREPKLSCSQGKIDNISCEVEKGQAAEPKMICPSGEDNICNNADIKGEMDYRVLRNTKAQQKLQQQSDWSSSGADCSLLRRVTEDPIFSTRCDEKNSRIKFQSVKHYICDVCDRSFSKYGHLTEHQRIHTRIRPYKCDMCNKSFARKSLVSTHLRTHSNEKPYKCDECDRNFGHKSDLIVHRRTHSGDRPFKCDLCGKCYMKCGDLTRHKRMHSGDRLYKCDVCHKTFMRSSSLTVHKRKHSGERPFKCDVCDQDFFQSGHLVRHKKKHSVDRLYIVIDRLKNFQR